MKTTLQTLEDARKLIEKPDAWRKSCPRDGAFCAQTAISRAFDQPDAHPRKEFEALGRAIGFQHEISVGDIWHWNDRLSRTHAEVLAAFDRAIEAERNKAEVALS